MRAGTQEEAARAYDLAALELRGHAAITNFDISSYTDYLQQLEQPIPKAQPKPALKPKAEPVDEEALLLRGLPLPDDELGGCLQGNWAAAAAREPGGGGRPLGSRRRRHGTFREDDANWRSREGARAGQVTMGEGQIRLYGKVQSTREKRYSNSIFPI